MTLFLTDRSDLTSIAETRARNDRFRAGLDGGWLILSAGLVALGAAAHGAILAHVKAFDDFETDDPWDAHDIGDFEIDVIDRDGKAHRELIFFRIVDLACRDGGVTKALVLMLAHEW